MTSFQQRKAAGDAHEQYVAEQLTMRGWDVSPWGQGLLTEQIQDALRKTDSFIRWIPDLIAAKETDLALIDCKTRMTSRSTGRHAVERAAVHAHAQLVAWTLLPVYYVFDDLDVLTPHDVLTTGRQGPHSIAGSGAPYFLIPATDTHRFDSLFGAGSPAAPWGIAS
ncbi:hypothetical protein [Streptomyces atriruber]|uniref:hypothetical protein n=1 Tax=Streptomyces atriruber TaxID=545121 RepID=UPI0006E2C5CB|nr:hypothetical protein [Streptomyces atriruber]